MTDFVQIPSNPSQMVVWDPNTSRTPYSTRWDTTTSVWDAGASVWDGGASTWDGGNPETYWVG